MNPTYWMLRLRDWWREESGQAATEYIGLTFLLFAATLGAAASAGFSKQLVDGLQNYVTFAFYCIDMALN